MDFFLSGESLKSRVSIYKAEEHPRVISYSQEPCQSVHNYFYTHSHLA